MKTQEENILVELHMRVSEVLFYVWDPIGVNGMVACRDEYDDYVALIAAYLLRDCERSSLDALLTFIMSECMELAKSSGRKSQHLNALNALLEWKECILANGTCLKELGSKFSMDDAFFTQIAWSREEARRWRSGKR